MHKNEIATGLSKSRRGNRRGYTA